MTNDGEKIDRDVVQMAAQVKIDIIVICIYVCTYRRDGEREMSVEIDGNGVEKEREIDCNGEE